jgi:lysophospholipase L1-like esterase
MTRHRGAPWWTVAVSGVIGVVLALVVTSIIGGRSVPFQAAAATKSATVAATTAPSAPKVRSVTFIGDSWTEGFRATALRGYAVLTGAELGWDYRVLGVGSSGYDLPGRGATFDQRVDRAVETHPDVIVVQGSLNEKDSTPEALAPAADETLAHLKAAASSSTHILVMGASYNPGTPNQTIDWINAAIKAAAARAGVPFVDVAAENWTDPQDASIWADVYHPNDAGYQLIADHLKPLLLSAVGS